MPAVILNQKLKSSLVVYTKSYSFLKAINEINAMRSETVLKKAAICHSYLDNKNNFDTFNVL